MASQFDLAPRLAAIQDAGLTVAVAYQSSPSRWLLEALAGVDVRVVNGKSMRPDDVICLIKLSVLEEILAAAPRAEDAPPPVR